MMKYAMASLAVGLLSIFLSPQQEAQAEGTFGFAFPNYFPAQSLGKFEGDILVELSGAAVGRVNPGVLWVHNDGPITDLYAIGKDGTHLATIALGVPVLDVEDIACASDQLYIGDIGSNDASRSTVSVIRAPEPDFGGSTSIGGDVSSLSYPDGGHDAEALMVDPLTGNAYIVSKENNRARVYCATPDQLAHGASTVLELVAEVPIERVSGGDISSDGLLIALRNESVGIIWKRSAGESIASALARPGVRIPVVGPPKEPNGEALAFEPADDSYYTLSEGKKEPVFHYRPNSSGYDFGSELGLLNDDTIKEVSGCALSGRSEEVIWIHNDGPISEIFAMDTTGRILARVLLGRTLVDAEDIAVGALVDGGEPFVFVGDIGDNDILRTSLGILRFPEPEIDPTRIGLPLVLNATSPELISVRYPGGRSDAEALMLDPVTRELVIATKSAATSTLYSIPATAPAGSLHTLTQAAQVSFSVVSAGDISPSGSSIVLRREEFAKIWERLPGQGLAAVFSNPGREIPVMTPPQEGNGEGIAFDRDGRGYFTIGEKKEAPVFYFARSPITDLVTISISLSNAGAGDFGLEMKGYPSISAILQRSVDLTQWADDRSVTLNGDGRLDLDIEPTAPAEFYRLRR